MTTISGSKMLTSAADAGAQAAADLVHRLQRGVVALPRSRDELARRAVSPEELPAPPGRPRAPRRTARSGRARCTSRRRARRRTSSTMWPSSAAAPTAPRYSFPSRTSPPPTPVPSVSITMYRVAAPGADLPLGERRRVRVVVDPDREREALAPSDRGSRGRRAGCARTRSPGRTLVDRRRKPEADRQHAVVAQLLDRLVRGRRADPPESRRRRPAPAGAPIRPSRSTTPAAIFVPPTSTPIVRCVLPRGYDTPPNGPGRKALPRLPWRTRQGPGADAGRNRSAPPARTDRKPFRFKGPGPKPEKAKGKANWRRRILVGVIVLFVLLLVWGVASYLALRGGASRANKRLSRSAKAALVPQSGLILSHPSVILLLGTDHSSTDQGRARASSARTR